MVRKGKSLNPADRQRKKEREREKEKVRSFCSIIGPQTLIRTHTAERCRGTWACPVMMHHGG